MLQTLCSLENSGIIFCAVGLVFGDHMINTIMTENDPKTKILPTLMLDVDNC